MNTFCIYIQEETEKNTQSMFRFLFLKTKLLHCSFGQPLVSYPFFSELIEFVLDKWNEKKFFVKHYEMVYPTLVTSLR